MEQTPIFIPMNEIAAYPYPMAMPDDAGRMALKAKGDTIYRYLRKNGIEPHRMKNITKHKEETPADSEQE
jgi:hypothetical protein